MERRRLVAGGVRLPAARMDGSTEGWQPSVRDGRLPSLLTSSVTELY